MKEFRLLFSVLPVGPRGKTTFSLGSKRWFAVHLAAAFDENPQRRAPALGDLWPWSVLDPRQSQSVTFDVWLLDEHLNASKIDEYDADATWGLPGFPKALQDEIVSSYTDPKVEHLDLRWLYPGETGDPVSEVASFGARLKYLSTLAGYMATDVAARVYVPVSIEKLFDPTNDWTPRGKYLWIGPRTAMVVGAQATADGQPPAQCGRHPDAARLFEQPFVNGGLAAAAFGPGFELKRLRDVDQHPIYDLGTHWLLTAPGESRYTTIETLLRDVLDPFRDLDALSADSAQGYLDVVVDGSASRPPTESVTAMLALWRIQGLAQSLNASAVRTAVEHLALRLDASAALAAEVKSKIDTRWILTGGLARDIEGLAIGFGLGGDSTAGRVRQVSEHAGSSAAGEWIVGAFESALRSLEHVPDGPATDVKELRSRWDFDEPATRDARRHALSQVVAEERLFDGEVRRVLDDLKNAGPKSVETYLLEIVKPRLKSRWDVTATGRLSDDVARILVTLELLPPKGTLSLVSGGDDEFVRRHLAIAWPAQVPKRSLPRRGIPLVVGRDRTEPGKHRLVHSGNADLVGGSAVDNGIFGEVAGISLLARRGKDDADVLTRPWRIVTAGVPMAGRLSDKLFPPDDADTWRGPLLPLAIRPVFQEEVARADLEYRGHPELTQAPLDLAYEQAFVMTQSEDDGFEVAYSFQSIGALRADSQWKEAATVSAAPVLRHGDVYQFASAVIDQAGGLPASLVDNATPWIINTGALRADTHIGYDPHDVPRIRYERTVPVGPLNIVPSRDQSKGGRQEWPKLPDNITLRCREWWSARRPGVDDVPVVLLVDQDLPDVRRRYVSTVGAPAIDEGTLLDWAAPALDSNDTTARDELREAFTAILEARAAGTQESPVHDPAVTAFAVRVSAVDANGTQLAPKVTPPVAWAPGNIPHSAKPVTFTVEAAPFNTSFDVVATPTEISVKVPEGQFVAVEIWPLVLDDDFARFAPAEIFGDALDLDSPTAGYRAFQPSVILAEVATDRLPTADELFAGLQLPAQVEAPGTVDIRFDTNPDYLQFVDTFEIRRDRWIWRSRPVVYTEDWGNAQQDERRRLACSGPPTATFDPALRDGDATVDRWEKIAALDDGFRSRGPIQKPWPRHPPDSNGPGSSAGGCRGDVLLSVDDRDASTAADYLRYHLLVRSRYMGVFKNAVVKDERRRRIAAPFRGGLPKPPKILAVLPLTRPLQEDPLPLAGRRATPFWVLVDEVWFREYGVGERLRARISLEGRDPTNPDDTDPVPYRVGPLPDHYLTTKSDDIPKDEDYFRTKRVTEDQEEQAARDRNDQFWLDLFGPFGYSLDVDPEQALANATAFVLYPPNDVGAWWALFVRFFRQLDRPSNDGQIWHDERFLSRASDPYPLYTVASDDRLVRPAGSLPGQATIDGADAKVRLSGMTWTLDPDEGNGAGRNTAAASQYRYVLLVSRKARDAASAAEVELPVALWRLDVLGKQGFVPPGTVDVVFDETRPCPVSPIGSAPSSPGRCSGRILEIMLNGRYEAASRLDEAKDFRDFWKRLLSVDKESGATSDEYPDHDSAGLIVRVSQAFDLEIA